MLRRFCLRSHGLHRFLHRFVEQGDACAICRYIWHVATTDERFRLLLEQGLAEAEAGHTFKWDDVPWA